jgi:hypothetical protein
MQELIKKLERQYGNPISEFTEVDWNLISEYQDLSEEFIIEFQDKVSWWCILMHQKLSKKFREKYKHKL